MKDVCPYCKGAGNQLISCCGDDMTGFDIDVCPTCFEHFGGEPEDCDECGGTGEIETEECL